LPATAVRTLPIVGLEAGAAIGLFQGIADALLEL
jgi:hypothetical protein